MTSLRAKSFMPINASRTQTKRCSVKFEFSCSAVALSCLSAFVALGLSRASSFWLVTWGSLGLTCVCKASETASQRKARGTGLKSVGGSSCW